MIAAWLGKLRKSSPPPQFLAMEQQVKTVTFKIEGMNCSGCANTIKALVEGEPGVQAATVSFDEGQARILYDPQTVGEDRLVATVQKPGFRVVERQ